MKASILDYKGTVIREIDVIPTDVRLPSDEDIVAMDGNEHVLGKWNFFMDKVIKPEHCKRHKHVQAYIASERDSDFIDVDKACGIRPMIEAEGLDGLKRFERLRLHANKDIDCRYVNGKLFCDKEIDRQPFRNDVELDEKSAIDMWKYKDTGNYVSSSNLVLYEKSIPKFVIDTWTIEMGLLEREQERWTPDEPEKHVSYHKMSLVGAVADTDAIKPVSEKQFSDSDILSGTTGISHSSPVKEDEGPEI